MGKTRLLGLLSDLAGDAEASVRHALAAGDIDLAAARAELAVPALLRERREAVICRWVEAVPAGRGQPPSR